MQILLRVLTVPEWSKSGEKEGGVNGGGGGQRWVGSSLCYTKKY